MQSTTGNGLRLLSFDGGGARALSQVKIMENIMHRIQCDMNPDDPNTEIQPHRCFDLIGGSDTGGILAIMFGKLHMSVEEAYEEFDKIRREVYVDILSAEERTNKLKGCIEDLLRRKGHPIDLKLRGKDGASCFVVATLKLSINNHIKLRSYISRSGSSNDVTVVDAILATCAAQPLFLPIVIGSGIRQQGLVGGIMGVANPCRELIAEAAAKFEGSSKISTIVSIGSGHLGTLSAPISEGSEDWATVLRSMIANSEKVAQDMEERMGRKHFYFRLSVEHGLQRYHNITGDDPLWINAQTEAYLDEEIIAERLDMCVEAILLRPNTVALRDLNGLKAPKTSQVGEIQSQLINEKEERILEHLRPADVKQDSLPEECMGGTRKDVLSQIEDWIEDMEAPNILWIKGYPGVGKSALASTIVSRLRERKRLGSKFFFRRAEADVSTAHAMWRYIAYKIALHYPSVKRSLIAKLAADEDLPTTGSIENLFQQLILKPLGAVSIEYIPINMSPVVVIDALDECGGLDGRLSQHRQNLLLSLQKWPLLPKRYKIIVTSRGEHDIDCSLREISRIIDIPTGSKVSDQSSQDIRTFLTSRFKYISNQSSSLSNDWPGPEVIQELVDRASGLFIWARLVMDFVERGEPEEQLLRIQEGDNGHGMPGLYSQILQIAFHDATDSVLEAFHAVIGAIIFLKRPLSARSLAQLLSIKETKIGYICDLLKPIIESGKVLHITHQSFVDLLLDVKCCPVEYYIEREHEEVRLTLACLSTMENSLRFNICDIETSHLLNIEIADIDERIIKNISDSLSYSTRYWAQHLSECNDSSKIEERLRYFMEVHFLYWLEVLSLTKQMNAASSLLALSTAWLKKHNRSYGLSMDLNQFVKTFVNVISQSVPHIYISSLPFAPQTSSVSKLYKSLYPRSLNVEVGGLETWPSFQNVMYGHSKSVTSVDFSPDGLKVVSGSHDGTLRVWDTETGEMVAGPFRGHLSGVNCVAFSPEGERIASGSTDQTVRLWDYMTGEMVAGPFEGYNGIVLSVAFSPEGKQIFSRSIMRAVIIDVEVGNVITRPFIGQHDFQFSVAFSPDGRRVASGFEENTICVWDHRTGDVVAGPFKIHTAMTYSISFSSNGQWVVSGSFDMTVRVWNAQTGHIVARPFEGHIFIAQSVAFSPDGRSIASLSLDGRIRIWDTFTSNTVTDLFDGYYRKITSFAFSPDGLRIVLGSEDNTVRVWDVDIKKNIERKSQEHASWIVTAAFSPDGLRIVSGSQDSTIRVWDTQTGRAVMESLYGHNGPAISVGFSPDGNRIFSGFSDGTVKLWDGPGGDVVVVLVANYPTVLQCIAFSPNGERIVTGSYDGTLMVCEAETGKVLLGPLKGNENLPLTAVFSPDGQKVVTGSFKDGVRLWDIDTGKIIAEQFKGQIGMAWSLAFSPDGNQIFCGSNDGKIRVWNPEASEDAVQPFKRHSGVINSVKISPDGLWIVFGSWGDDLRVWSVETGEIASGPFIGHTLSVLALAFSPDGQWFVSGSDDKTLRVWKTHPSTQHNPIFTVSSRFYEGWIRDSQNRRLLWVPPTLRDGLIRPDAKFIIGDMIKTRLNLDSFVYGKEWMSCRSERLPTL